MAAARWDAGNESSGGRPPRTTCGSSTFRLQAPRLPIVALAVLLGAAGADAGPGLASAVMGKGSLLMNKLPFMSGKAMGALKSKGLAFQWQSFQKVAGGFVSMRADVSARFKKNLELANENWEERTETLAQMAPTALVTATHAPVTTEAGKLTRAEREEEEQAEAARKAGLSETQYRHMMTHYRTLRPKMYLRKMLADKQEALVDSPTLAPGDVTSEAPVLGATSKEEVALGKRREKIHESRRHRHHTRHAGDTLYPMM